MMETDVVDMSTEPTSTLEPSDRETIPPQTDQNQTLLLSGIDDEDDLDLGPTQSLPQKTASILLIENIISPSPFAHHHDAATADRYRSALQRIHVAPQTDVEAWQAIMNECLTLYRSQVLPSMEEERQTYRQILLGQSFNASGSATPLFRRAESLENQLDWIESCHGHLFQFFPYAANYYVSALELLLARSAFLFESLTGGDLSDDDLLLLSAISSTNSTVGKSNPFWIQKSTSQELYERKMNLVFQQILGLTLEGSSNLQQLSNSETTSPWDDDTVLYGASKQSNHILGGMCTSCVELWLLYVRKRTRDARRDALQQYLADSTKPPSSTNISSVGEEYIRDTIIDAYESALKNGAACAINNHLIWKQYLTYVKSWNVIQITKDSITQVDQNLLQKQRQTLRTIYQRLVAIPMTGLDSLWLEYEAFEKAQNEQLAVALVAEHLPKYQHARSVYLERNRVVNMNDLRMGRLATPPIDLDMAQKGGESSGALMNALKTTSVNEGKWTLNQEDYYSKMKDECIMLAKWQRRCAYERTNPERLSVEDLSERIRLVYKDFVSCFMRHVEVWHEWSTWELLSTSGAAASTATTSNQKSRKVKNSLAVLALAQHQLPDSTLLAYMEANVLEGHFSGSKALGATDEESSTEHPSIQAMEKFCNRNPSTLGFVLLQRFVRKYKGKQEARAVFARARRILKVRPKDTFSPMNVETNEPQELIGGEGTLRSSSSVDEHPRKSMTTNRAAFLHVNGSAPLDSYAPAHEPGTSNEKITGHGIITWHLYASHASIEHRLNGAPHIAGRIFELGLRRHRSFLSIPQFVLQYAALLLELKDENNLRALLTRSISACEEDLQNDTDMINPSSNLAKKEAQRPLWDMMLRFESVLSSGDSSAVQIIEARRRRALFGPQHEDIAGGDMASVGTDGDIGIGIQRSNLGEILIRSEGYDVCSRISNGMHRLVDSLETTGLWADGFSVQPYSSLENQLNSLWKDDDASSGASDASFRRRVTFKEHYRLLSAFPNLGDSAGSGTSGKLLSAKERLAQGTTQTSMASLMTQTIPEWLRGLVLLLPLNPRILRGAKAPPYLIETTLAALRDSSLPMERPNDDDKGLNINATVRGSRKRLLSDKKSDGENDSSDEEEGSMHTGYSDQFRARQRARLMDLQTNNNEM